MTAVRSAARTLGAHCRAYSAGKDKVVVFVWGSV